FVRRSSTRAGGRAGFARPRECGRGRRRRAAENADLSRNGKSRAGPAHVRVAPAPVLDRRDPGCAAGFARCAARFRCRRAGLVVSFRWLFHVMSPGGRRGRLPVMIFHRVLPQPDALFPGEPDAARFDAQLALLKRWFNILPLPDAIRGLREERLPPRPLTLTFDDGYADNCTVALPILQRHGLRAAFFIATDFLAG